MRKVGTKSGPVLIIPDSHVVIVDDAGTHGVIICPRSDVARYIAAWFPDASPGVTQTIHEFQEVLNDRRPVHAYGSCLGVSVL